jgi:squalene-hopene/tetraprenyl-beta-curcumene cyclase
LRRAIPRARHYLDTAQRADGAWIPLWFGNQAAPEQENPVYGTARVLAGLRPLGSAYPDTAHMIERGNEYLVNSQGPDGGWGGAPGTASSIEETGLAVAALDPAESPQAVERGVEWILQHTADPTNLPATPMGLYFAKLWYSERLYPLLTALTALH